MTTTAIDTPLPVKSRLPLHLLLLSLLAIGIGVLFIHEPGFGDDLTYWTFGYDLHDVGLKAWGKESFHDLRWPVWGVCWIIQGLGGTGMAAYSGTAIVYLVAGALVTFAFGQLLTRSIRFSWAAAIAFLLCPLIDTVCHRPMPDLSEGIIGGATLLAWWRLMHAEKRGASLGWAALTGLLVFLTESNRLTGVFIVPVLIVATLLFARQRFWWLVVAGCFSVGFYAAEAAFYHALFNDWLHNLNANMNGKDNKGTGNIPLLTAPFRFLDSLWGTGRLSPLYAICALVGLWSLVEAHWRGKNAPSEPSTRVSVPAGKLVAVWFGVLYLEYACAPQSLWPWKPVIRDAARFLAGLSIPLSLLAVLGLRYVLTLPFFRERRWNRWLTAHPLLVGAVALALLCGFTSRPFFDLGFLGPMRAYVHTVKPGTKVFTHHMMRALAILADPTVAEKIQWTAPREILERNALHEQQAAASDEFWYMRKLVWMNTRKRMERKKFTKQPQMATFFEHPDDQWALAKLLVKGDSPDMHFYRKRTPGMPLPVVLNAGSPELAELVPTLPIEWKASKRRSVHGEWKIPPVLRGKCVQLEFEASSNEVETAGITIKFKPNNTEHEVILLKPYTYAEGGSDFFTVPIPSNAEECTYQARFSREVKQAQLLNFRMLVITPLDGL